MKRRVNVLLIGVLLTAAGSGVMGSASAQADTQVNIAIQSVNISVEEPAPGESFTLSTTVNNLQSSSGAAEVTDVYVYEGAWASGELQDKVNNVGSIAPGSSLEIPLSMSLDDLGEQRLTVSVIAKDPSGNTQRVNYPLYVDIAEPDEAAISFATPDDLVAGQESPVNVTVSNGDNKALSNVQLELGGESEVNDPKRVSASIPSGSQETNTFQVTFPKAGEQLLEATVTYKTSDGSTRTIQRDATFDVEETNLDPELTASGTTANGSSAIGATLTEYGNVELRDVEIKAVADNQTVTRAQTHDVPADGSRSVMLDGSDVPPGDVTVVAQYTAAGEQRTAETTLTYSPQETANITFTGVDVSRQGSTLTLSGDAANIGSSNASSVRVNVVNTDSVTPVSPNKKYFIGSIEASEFGTFELTANTVGNVTQVPVRISYSADGERYSRTVSVDTSGLGTQTDNEQPKRSSGFPLVQIGMVLGVAVVGAAVYRWRKQ